MREVFVYVEGPSDQLGMRELFADVMDIAKQKGRTVDFYPLNGKEPLMNKGPIRALNILRNRRNSRDGNSMSKDGLCTFRKDLSGICVVPDKIISVYSLEKHVWADSNSEASRKARKPELQPIEEF